MSRETLLASSLALDGRDTLLVISPFTEGTEPFGGFIDVGLARSDMAFYMELGGGSSPVS